MRGTIWILVSTAIGAFVVSQCALAQEGSPQTVFEPMDLYKCHFNEGRDMNDLLAVTEVWNSWMDANATVDYTGIILSPLYNSADIPFDVFWLGAWSNGASLGAGLGHWIDGGQAMHEEFADVLTCPVRQNFAALMVSPPAGPPRENPIAQSNCSLHEGQTTAETVAAVYEWVEHLADEDLAGGNWLLFPMYGETAGADYTFSWIVGYQSYERFGLTYDHYATGRGQEKFNETFGHLMECNSPTLYHENLVRMPNFQ